VNIGEPWPDSDAARWRVLEMQTKLHQWATDDPKRRFDDLYNLVHDPAVLVVAWERVRANRGQGQPESMEWHPARSCSGERNCSPGCEMISRPVDSNRCRCGNG